MTLARFSTTVTERASFRSCRRQWWLEVVERLSPKDRVTWYFEFGEAVHIALEAYYRDGKRNLGDMLSAFEQYWDEFDNRLHRTYGGLYESGIGEEWWNYKEKAEVMFRYYDLYDKASGYWDDVEEILAVNIEERAFVDILNAQGRHIPMKPLLSGRIDLVLLKKDGHHIWDHKTAATPYDARALDVDDQLTGYSYIYWRLTGVVPKSATYNALIKEPPTPPKILVNGSISKDKSQRTTYDLYLMAMDEQGIAHDDEAYAEILQVLLAKGWSQFFLRDGLVRNLEEIQSFEKRLFYEYQDMDLVLAEPERAYPNPTQRTCPGCGVLPICQMMEEQGDVEYIKENMYEILPVRAEIPEEILNPKWKGV